MTDEELAALINDIDEQIKQLPEDDDKPLSKEERKQRALLQAKSRALHRIKETKESGNLHQEARACMDYALLEQYGHKNLFLLNFMRSQFRWWGL